MIYGIGVDLMHIDQIKDYLSKENPKPFLKKVYTKKEILEAGQVVNKNLFYALRFCGKEAVYKALDIPEIQFNEIEILNTKSGKPTVVLYGLTRQLAKEKGIREIKISLSSDKKLAIANVVAVK